MPIPRRDFLQTSTAYALGATFWAPFGWPKAGEPRFIRLFHTNDWHGQFEGYDRGWVPGQRRGISQVAVLQALRQTHPKALLVDLGDLIQPGRVEAWQGAQFLNEFDYNVFLPGAAEWQSGRSGLDQLHQSVSGRVLRPLGIKEQLGASAMILERQGVKIAFLGLDRGAHLPAVVPESQIWKTVDYWASNLRRLKGAQIVVVLSRLGLLDAALGPGDLTWATQTKEIDLVIGGGSHTFMEEPLAVQNAQGRRIWINHAGADGAMVGSLELIYHPQRGLDLGTAKNIVL